ncbi:tumor necrosis factor receptor superfamily member 14-like, partial [Chiloscyllium punctatum]|uniref:tumor necrosis factor receptor superfamily member 14-like n=1 Tax=Chiloscyllium punctatum TaxID=137246 RepID=UPI003B6347B2
MSTCPAGQYKHNGLCCPKCQPGYHKHLDCNKKQTTKCSPCGPDEYMDYDNYVNYCLRCSECEKGSNLVRLRACSPRSDTRCGCKPGFYCSVQHSQRCERCREISSCPPGQGVTAQ